MTAVRKFIRHPSDIPILVCEVCRSKHSELPENQEQQIAASYMNNVSLGGLAFFSSQAFMIDHHVVVSVPCLDANSHVEGCVLWCKKVQQGYEVGLEFDDPKAVFRLRMIEQICHIEHYRKEIKRIENREMSSEQAAQEWISKYAADFPSFDSSH